MAAKTVNVNRARTSESDFGAGTLDPLKVDDPSLVKADNAIIAADARIAAMKDEATLKAQSGGGPQNNTELLMGKGAPVAINSAHAASAATKINKNNASKRHYEELYKKGEKGVDATIEEVKGQIKEGIRKSGDPKFTSDPFLSEEMANSVIPNKDLYRDVDGRLQITKYYHDLVANTESYLSAVKTQGINNMLGEIEQGQYAATDTKAQSAAKAQKEAEQPQVNPMEPPAAPAAESVQPASPEAAVQAAPAEEPEATAMIPYKIKSGDTMGEIAAANGTTVEAIMKANPSIKDKGAIVKGKTLLLPGTEAAVENDNIVNGADVQTSSGASSSSSSSSSVQAEPITSTTGDASGRNEDEVRQAFALDQITNTNARGFGSVAAARAAGATDDQIQAAIDHRQTYSTNDLTNENAAIAKESNRQSAANRAAASAAATDIKRNLALLSSQGKQDTTTNSILELEKSVAQSLTALTMLGKGYTGEKTGLYSHKKVQKIWQNLNGQGITMTNLNDPANANNPDVKYIKEAILNALPLARQVATSIKGETSLLKEKNKSYEQSQAVIDALSLYSVAEAVDSPEREVVEKKKKQTSEDILKQ